MKALILTLILNAGIIFKDGFEAPPAECSSSQYPPGLRRINGTYAEFNDGHKFGESTNATFDLNMRIDSFYVLDQFSFEKVEGRRRIVFEKAPSNYNLMIKGTVSVSKCPGDFTQSAQCVIPVQNNTTIIVSSKTADTSSGSLCKVVSGEQYYINYVLSDDPFNTRPVCDNLQHQTCAMFYSEAEL